jgi:hypothetical protein
MLWTCGLLLQGKTLTPPREPSYKDKEPLLNIPKHFIQQSYEQTVCGT